MKKILVPIDFSGVSENGLKFAVDVAQKIDAEIYLLGIDSLMSIRNEKEISVGKSGINIDPAGEDKKAMNEIISAFSYAGIVIIPLSHNDGSGIDSFIKQNKIDFIITGLDPDEENTDAFNLQAYKHFIEVVNCPVFSVLRKAEYIDIEDIVLLFNEIEDKYYPGLELIRNFANGYNAKMHMLSVVDPDQQDNYDILKRLEEIAEDYAMPSFTINTINNLNISDGARNFVRRKNSDITAVIGKDQQSDLMISMFEESKCPVFCRL